MLYRWYVVGVLTLAYILSFVDRQILALLVEPIKADLGISDTAISLLMGFAFALFYCTLGVPIARLADQHSRRALIAVGIVLWSVMTMLCGLARGYPELFMARVGVGVGEAALVPAALSMIADTIPARELGRAIGLFTMGPALGVGLAYLLGGTVLESVEGSRTVLPLVGERAGWQVAFLVAGAPGLLLGMLMLTVREPVRPTRAAGAQDSSASFRKALAFLVAERRLVVPLFLGMSMLTITGYGIGYWIPSHFIRTYGLGIGEISIKYGLLVTVLGTASPLLGGWLADHWALQHRDGYLRAALLGFLIMLPGYALFALAPTATLSLLCLVPATIGAAMAPAAGLSALVHATPSSLRAQVSACYLLFITLFGLTLGPLAVAFLTDTVFADEAMLRYSLAVVGVFAGVIAVTAIQFSRRAYGRA